MLTPRYTSKITTELKKLYEREETIKEIISPILAERYFAWKPPRASSNSIRIDLKNSVGGHLLQSILDDFRVEYFELWKATDVGTGENQLWNLDQAYFALLKKNYESEDFNEFLALHCEAGFLPERNLTIPKNKDFGYLKQKKQEKYQRRIHLHNVFLSSYAEEKNCPKHSFLSVNSCLSKSHIGVTLGSYRPEFYSIHSMTKAMKESVQMIKDEILDVLAST